MRERVHGVRPFIAWVVASLVLGPMAVPAVGAEGEPPEEAAAFVLEPGPWLGSAVARGNATYEVPGLRVTHDVEIDAELSFDVVGDAVDGTWTYTGTGVVDAVGNYQGMSSTLHAEVTYGGGGPIRGTSERPRMTGTSRTTGTGYLEAQDRRFPIDPSSRDPVPPLDVRITYAECDQATGDWTFSINQRLAEEGFTPSFSGQWVALRQDEWAQQMEATEFSETVQRLQELVDEFNAAIDPFDRAGSAVEFEDLPPLDLDALADLLQQAEQVTNELRNLSTCERDLLGEEKVERFVSVATQAVQHLIEIAVGQHDLSADWIRTLLQVGLRTAAVGAGAELHQQRAVALEEGLREEAEAILQEHVSDEGVSLQGNACDPCLDLTGPVKKVLVLGAQRGWTYEFAGRTRDPRDILAAGEDHDVDWKADE